MALDAVQQAPELFRAIKLSVDQDRRPGRYLLTGSANVLLPQLAEALVGRMETLCLWPLSQGELAGRREGFVDALFRKRLSVAASASKKDDLVERVLLGGYPEALARAEASRRESWFQSYVSTILLRDVRDLAAIEKTTALPRLLSLLAVRAGTLLNVAELSRIVGLPQTSLKRYLALLETVFLVIRVPPWWRHAGKRLTKTPKLYLTDTGLLAHLVGLNAGRLQSEPTRLGPLLENFVAVEILKQLGWSTIRAGLHHFRTHAGQEVDLVLEDAEGRIAGIEVKAAAHVESRDLNGLIALRELVGSRFVQGVVLYRGTEAVPFGDRLHAVPFSSLWQT